MAKKELLGLVTKEEFFNVKDDSPWTTEQIAEGGFLVSDMNHSKKVWCKVASVSEFYQLLHDYNVCKGISYTETAEERKIRTSDLDKLEE